MDPPIVDNPSLGQTSSSTPISPSSGDASFLPMTTVKLDGSNYMNWKVEVEVYLIAKRKVYTIRRDPPAALDPTYEQWETDDAHIRSLLWQSMIPQISGTMMQLPTAKRIWDHTAVMFSGVGNLSRISATYSEWMHLRRGDTPLSTYYGQFVSHCQQLDIFLPLTTDLAVVARQRDQLRVVQFLDTLGPEFIFFRQQIYGSGTMPSLDEVYQRAQQYLGGASLTPAVFYGDATAAHAVGDRPARGGWMFGRGRGRDSSRGGRAMGTDFSSGRGYGGRPRPYCTHCRREGHVMRPVMCYILSVVPRRHLSSGNQRTFLLWKTLILEHLPPAPAQLYRLSLRPTMMSSSAYAWLPMLPVLALHNQSMTLADGRTTPISGTGSTSPYPGLTLSSDLTTGRTIGKGREVDGLYRLDGGPPRTILHSYVDAYQWHCHLGHPCIERLRRTSIVSVHIQSFQCEACELGKHHRVSFPSRLIMLENISPLPMGSRIFFPVGVLSTKSSCAHISQQNGMAERKMRSLLDGARSLLIHMRVPKSYWGDAVLTACHLANRLPSSKGYHCYSPRLRRSFVSADITFFESESYFVSSHETPSTVPYSDLPLPLPTLPAPLLSPHVLVPETIPVCDPSSSLQAPEATEDPPPAPPQTYPRRPRSTAHPRWPRSTTHPPPPEPSSLLLEITPPHLRYLSLLLILQILPLLLVLVLTSLPAALDHSGWRAAMNLEMEALQTNKTWELVPLPPGARPVGCRWVYAVKHLPDGTIEHLKARFVAKGYTQTFGVDYLETFSSVAKISYVRVLLSLAGAMSSSVCRLRKSIYGLKQSPRAWFGRFSDAIMHYGMKQCAVDHSVFSSHSTTGCVLLIVYVDDIIITGSDSEGIRRLKTFLQNEFSTKDLGRLRYFLGIEVAYSTRGLSLSQRKYVLDLLEETGHLGVKPASAPMDPNRKLLLEEGDLLDDPGRYRRLVGKLIYLTVTRPDISFVVGSVSQHMSSPRTSHWAAVIQILRYLKEAPGKGLATSFRGVAEILASNTCSRLPVVFHNLGLQTSGGLDVDDLWKGISASISTHTLANVSLDPSAVLVAIICLSVDDMFILGSDLSVVSDVKPTLSKEFDMKDLGVVDIIFGIKVSFGRQDITFTVGMLSRFTSSSSHEHWNALMRLMRYLKGTQDYALCYRSHPPVLEGYSDASWGSESEDSKFIAVV
ncbi:uncharacterized protein LOC143852403 [Tasmannia lanceolata]|uniref:uncharacterized protein LOC143852403 n=1 Tax=Tasmannia lanceolata TaxID=3420 RepID=UPI0040630168